jgi:hypothetical protein
MQLTELMCAVLVSLVSLVLTIGGYILQRQRHWKQVWENLGQPQVDSIRELKLLSRKQDQAASSLGARARQLFKLGNADSGMRLPGLQNPNQQDLENQSRKYA